MYIDFGEQLGQKEDPWRAEPFFDGEPAVWEVRGAKETSPEYM